MYEKEGVISTWDLCLDVLNRSIPFFPMMDIIVKPRKQRFIKTDLPFIDEIPGLTMIKLFNVKTGCTNTIKVTPVGNTGFLDVTVY